jgi:hypothetical protein
MKKAAALSILVAVMLLAVAVIAEAQQPKKVARIGYLSSSDAATDSARAEGLRRALRERGYIEGQNIAIEYRYAEGKRDRESGLAAELVRLKVAIIVVPSGDVTIRAAKNATKTIPSKGGIGGDATRDREHDGLRSLVTGVVLPTRVIDCTGFPLEATYIGGRTVFIPAK